VKEEETFHDEVDNFKQTPIQLGFTSIHSRSPHHTMVKITPQLVIGASVATVATAGVAYAVYFDYRRRNDPAFRKRLGQSIIS